jgi:hypothetical protein
MLNIPYCKTGNNLRDDDLAFISNLFNLNLFIIYETNENTNAIIYWKPNRQNIGIFHKNFHWIPVIFIKTNNPQKCSNITINTSFPDSNTIKKYINNHFERQNCLQNTNNNLVIGNNNCNYYNDIITEK